MPQQKGRRVVRRLLRWHVPTAGHPGPALVTLATAIAIVSALIFSPGILAYTPYGTLPAASSAGAGATRGFIYNPAERAGSSDDFGSSLVAGTSGATSVDASTSPWIGWPPFGITPIEVAAPADDVIPALLKVAVERLAATPRAAPRKHPNPVRPTKPVTRVAAWNVAPIVTWYGPGFYGGKTACGQRYTRYIVGVASRTLPCGTLVQFSWHGISVVAPVIPALLKVAVERLAATPRATPRKHPNPVRPTKPVTRVAAWNVAPIVTWYGPGFYGGKTACGQRYTRSIVGVASRTLPCGTLVQFNWHGINVVAPVIDRGPYASSAYVFDFSAKLACDLFRERGAQNGCFTRYDVRWRVVGRR